MNNDALVDYWTSVKTIVDKICENYDGLWSKRRRILNSKIILMIILKMLQVIIDKGWQQISMSFGMFVLIKE